MNTKYLIPIVTFSLFILVISCKIAPKKIAYGSDHCQFCDMTVVDKTHAAEYVTKKGKPYVFDAIECMINYQQKNDIKEELAFILVANYNHPGKLINANEATYLISDKIKSPMGANLSAFASKKEAQIVQKKFGGKLYTWIDLKAKFAQ